LSEESTDRNNELTTETPAMGQVSRNLEGILNSFFVIFIYVSLETLLSF
jgi:hypothetical protein